MLLEYTVATQTLQNSDSSLIDYYDVVNVSQPTVAHYNITHNAATFAVDIQSVSALMKNVCVCIIFV